MARGSRKWPEQRYSRLQRLKLSLNGPPETSDGKGKKEMKLEQEQEAKD